MVRINQADVANYTRVTHQVISCVAHGCWLCVLFVFVVFVEVPCLDLVQTICVLCFVLMFDSSHVL